MESKVVKPVIFWILSAALLLITVVGMMTIGTADINVRDIITVVWQKVCPDAGGNLPRVYSSIIWDIRWPRIALAVLVGSSLAVSGACYQAIFKNPLAEPFILGVSSGAALGAAVAIVLALTAHISLFAFVGGTLTVVLVYLIGRGRGDGVLSNQLLLAGIALAAMCNALLSLLMSLHTKQLHVIFFWLLGSLTRPPDNLVMVAVVAATGLSVIMLYARDLDILTLGDENASFVGVDVTRVKVVLLFCTTLITSVVVAVSGIIGFIGLIVPHLVRKIIGPQHRILLPMCAVWGAIFMLWADGLIRMTASLSQIPVGVFTALLGSPFFLYILYTTGSKR